MELSATSPSDFVDPTEGGALLPDPGPPPTEAGPVGVGVELELPFLGVLVIFCTLLQSQIGILTAFDLTSFSTLFTFLFLRFNGVTFWADGKRGHGDRREDVGETKKGSA